MAFFALLWKARTIEKYRLNYEKEKINSIVMGHTQMEQTLSQRWRHYRYDTKKRISTTFRRWYPEGSGVANFFIYLKTDQTFPNFLLKSVMGFVGGIVLTYLCFMFFVFQLSISLIHATIMSSIIGVLLTLGLAFSYRIRCLVFLLIPQFFSRVGRYTLTCYALVLILTGPATNTLKNSEVLSESMACSQEQIKTSVHQLNDLMKKPYNAMKDSIKLMVDRLKMITMKVKETMVSIDRLVLSLVSFIQTSFYWLQSVADICNAKLGTPYDRCNSALQDGIANCEKTYGQDISIICDLTEMAQTACYSVKPFTGFCYVSEFMDEAILAGIKKKLKNFTEHLRAMFHVEVHIHHSYSFSSNTSRSASQVTAGIVTEIRNRADPLLTWLSWSSCVTSLFLLLIIFRAKYYQHMYETRSRFDNRYVTKELQELDLKRQRQGRETVLPLNRRERAKYITTTSFRLVASEKVYLNRSAVFMAITTFKLLIHMVADYSLYWVLMTIRFHGRYQSDLMPGIPHSGVHVSGDGFAARLFRSIVETLDIPLASPAPSPISCLPDPYPPDLRRYTQIGVLIFLLWFFALFEPYGLRLRHLIMGHYRPERAKARATWLYNHILRTRAGFMKFARRKLHREYKYSSEASNTFRQWMTDHIPFRCLRFILGYGPTKPHCLLCGTTRCEGDPDTQLTRCQTPGCPGIFCISCFTDIGQLCTICLTPVDYGDFSDVSLEKGSSDDSDGEGGMMEDKATHNEHTALFQNQESNCPSRTNKNGSQRWRYFTRTGPIQQYETFAYKQIINNYNGDLFTAYFKSQLRKIKSNMLHLHHWDKKYTKSWVSKLTSENSYIDLITYEDNNDFYSNTLDIEPYVEFEDAFKKTRSIGMNTDKNRGIILNTLIKSFTRLKTKRPHVNKQRRVKSDLFQVKTVHYEKIVKSKEYGSIKSNGGILDRYVVNPQQNYTILTKTFHTHNLKTCQKNLLRIIGCDKDYDKIYTDVKGTLKAMKYFTKNNEITNITNQNNETAPNNPPAQNKDETNKPSDNTKKEGKKNKKKASKINKPRKPKKQKDCNKVKNPNSPHKMSEFHTFFSNHWNHFKCTMMPCATRNRSDSPMTKEKKNHKRRKKRKAGTDVKETDKEKSFAKKDIRHTRNLRISAFLAELEWSKRDYKKVKDYEGNDGSFFPTDGLQAPRNANKIVGMVRLKNLPFQWREVPKPSVQTCDCKDEKCTCHNKTSDKELKLLEPTTSKPENAKKALERFRNKINSADTSPSSLVQKVMKSLKAEDHKSPPHDSSICISKRASGFKTIAQDPSESRLMDTNIIFKNENYLEDLQNPSHSAKEESSKLALCQNLVGKELIVSRSSKCRKLKCRASKKCKCDIYEDIQRKWAHVRKNFSNKGMKYPLSIMKNICSSLFGQSCTIDSCPNRSSKSKAKRLAKEKKECQKAKEKAEKLAKAKAKKNKKDLQAGTQTMPEPKKCMEPVAVQTCSRKDAEIQKMSGSSIPPQEVIIKNKPQEVLPSECKLEFKEKIIECKPKPAECKNEKVKCKGSPTGSRNEEILKFGREEYERQAIEREEDLIAEKLEKERLAMERSLKRLAELEKKKFEVDPCIKDSQTLIECEEKELLKFLDFNKSKSQVQFNSVPCSGQCSVLECTEKQQKKCQKPVQTPKETLNKGICAAPEKQDTGQKYQCLFMRIAQTGLSSTTEFNGLVPGFSTCQPRDCPNSCNAFVQYNKNDVCCDSSYDKKDVCTESYDKNDLCNRSYDKNDTYCTRSYDKNDVCHKYCDRTVATCNNKALENTKAVGSSKCLCDKALQVELKHTCTCATQHVFSAKNTGTIKPSEPDIRSFMVDASTRSMVSKGTLCSTGTRNIFEKKKKDGTSLGNSKRRKLSLENSLCVIDRKQTVSDALQEVLTDTITDDTSFSSLSISDDTKTDTTICSLATFDYDDHPRRRKFRVKVVTKTNQATLTDKTRLCDTGTVTSDWWSPIVERKCYDEILLEKKTGYNTIEKQKKELRELKEWKELREVRKRRKTCGVTTDGRIVTFRSRTQIIPTGFLPTTKDIMSPSRYLLESQKYYNELFSYNFRPPAQANFCVNQVPKYHEREKVRSPLGSRRNHHRKTKRLDECYSPRRQLSPRKRYTDSTKTAESPHRRSGYRADGHRLYNSSRTTDDDNITARNIFFEQQGHVCSGQSVIHGRILLEKFFS